MITSVTVLAFLQSHDRAVLNLQDDADAYIREVESELEGAFYADRRIINGQKQWPLSVMLHWAGITGQVPCLNPSQLEAC